jgi:hypothetical protein
LFDALLVGNGHRQAQDRLAFDVWFERYVEI